MTDESKQVKDSITVEGITEDYVWYHSKQLIDDMQGWQFKFERVVKVMESRNKEHLEMINDLIRQNKFLKAKVKEQEK
jgi:citrate lyase alpha subunit